MRCCDFENRYLNDLSVTSKKNTFSGSFYNTSGPEVLATSQTTFRRAHRGTRLGSDDPTANGRRMFSALPVVSFK